MVILTNTVTIVLLTIASGGCLLIFALFWRAIGGKYLDGVCSLRRAKKIVADMTELQARKHLWVTTYLDTIFPVCYGLLLAGLAIRFSSKNTLWQALPAAFAVLFDFMENRTHFIALKTKIALNTIKIPKTKPLFSILKWIFFALALAYSVFLILRTGLNAA